MNEPGCAEAVRGQHVFDKNTDGPRELMQRVVQSHKAIGKNMGKKAVEVGFGSSIAVVAVDPK